MRKGTVSAVRPKSKTGRSPARMKRARKLPATTPARRVHARAAVSDDSPEAILDMKKAVPVRWVSGKGWRKV